MMTIGIWHDFIYKINSRFTTDEELAAQLILTVIGTPLAILADIICLPFEIIWLIALNYIEKIRK